MSSLGAEVIKCPECEVDIKIPVIEALSVQLMARKAIEAWRTPTRLDVVEMLGNLQPVMRALGLAVDALDSDGEDKPEPEARPEPLRPHVREGSMKRGGLAEPDATPRPDWTPEPCSAQSTAPDEPDKAKAESATEPAMDSEATPENRGPDGFDFTITVPGPLATRIVEHCDALGLTASAALGRIVEAALTAHDSYRPNEDYSRQATATEPEVPPNFGCIMSPVIDDSGDETEPEPGAATEVDRETAMHHQDPVIDYPDTCGDCGWRQDDRASVVWIGTPCRCPDVWHGGDTEQLFVEPEHTACPCFRARGDYGGRTGLEYSETPQITVTPAGDRVYTTCEPTVAYSQRMPERTTVRDVTLKGDWVELALTCPKGHDYISQEPSHQNGQMAVCPECADAREDR